MNFDSLLSDGCKILRRTVNNKGKTSTESWTDPADAPVVKCRMLKREAHVVNLDKTQSAHRIRVRVVLRKATEIDPRDRIWHQGRIYSVIEIIEARGAFQRHHLNAVCEAVA